jgi:uncharacterized protein YabE (DUF348 family)
MHNYDKLSRTETAVRDMIELPIVAAVAVAFAAAMLVTMVVTIPCKVVDLLESFDV